MRVAIAGGNGFIGRALTTELTRAGHRVVWLSHRPGRAAERAEAIGPALEVGFEPSDVSGPWTAELVSSEVVVNLSGYPISARWNDQTRELMRASRLESTRAMVEAAAVARREGVGPTALVNASGAGIYGDRGDDLLAEDEPPGEDWLARLAADWEAEAMRSSEHGMRVVTVRTAVVLGAEGALPRLVMPMRSFVGGPLGTGRQWFPWIHLSDIVGLYRHAIESTGLEGPVNAGAPGVVRMADFSRVLGGVMNRPSWFPVPLFALRLVVGQSAPSLIASQRLDPGKLLKSGFEFRFPDAESALRDILTSSD